MLLKGILIRRSDGDDDDDVNIKRRLCFCSFLIFCDREKGDCQSSKHWLGKIEFCNFCKLRNCSFPVCTR